MEFLKLRKGLDKDVSLGKVQYGYFLDHPFDSYGATKKSVTESSMTESSMRGNSSACIRCTLVKQLKKWLHKILSLLALQHAMNSKHLPEQPSPLQQRGPWLKPSSMLLFGTLFDYHNYTLMTVDFAFEQDAQEKELILTSMLTVQNATHSR